MITPVGGFIVVTKVKELSVAGEDHKVILFVGKNLFYKVT